MPALCFTHIPEAWSSKSQHQGQAGFNVYQSGPPYLPWPGPAARHEPPAAELPLQAPVCHLGLQRVPTSFSPVRNQSGKGKMHTLIDSLNPGSPGSVIHKDLGSPESTEQRNAIVNDLHLTDWATQGIWLTPGNKSGLQEWLRLMIRPINDIEHLLPDL